MKKLGRPPKYTDKLAKEICDLIAEGYSLRQIEAREDMPSKTIILRWAATKEDFVDQYAQAMQIRLEGWADEINDIADDGSNDYVTRTNKDGSEYEVFDHEHVQRSRLRIDSRKWLLSKLVPKKYGEKIQQEISGKDGTPFTINIHPYGQKPED